MTVKIDETDREMIARGDRIGADLARALLRFYDEGSAATPASADAQTEARAIWHDALNHWMKASRHGTKVDADDIAAEIITTALAAKDAKLVASRKVEAALERDLMDARARYMGAEAQLAEANEALESAEDALLWAKATLDDVGRRSVAEAMDTCVTEIRAAREHGGE